MPEYRVRVEIDVEAATPLAAAIEGANLLRASEQDWVVDVVLLHKAQLYERLLSRSANLEWRRFDLDVDGDPDLKVEPADEPWPRRLTNNEDTPEEG